MPRTRAPRRWASRSDSGRPPLVALVRPAQLLRAPTDRVLERRALAVLRCLDLWTPSALAAHGAVSYARLLAAADWVRPLDQWVGEGRLVDHLVRERRYDLPKFLYPLLFGARWNTRPSEDAVLALRVLEACGRGRPLREVLPMLGRREAHRVWITDSATSVVDAVRRAQVAEAGGPPWLAESLAGTRLGAAFGPEDRWGALVRLLAKHADAVGDQRVGPIVDYVCATEALPTSIGQLLRDQAAWHTRVLPTAGGPRGPLPRSGLEGWSAEDWSIRELDSGEALVAEGQALRHCVATYHGVVVTGRSSIWSVRRAGVRALTVEVWNQQRAVVQIRGLANRRATPAEVALIRAWAHQLGLEVRDG